jgi:SnoaL-like domain
MSADDDLRATVRALADRQAIRDCVARYCRGVDRFDRELILSAFHPDALDEHGKFVGQPHEFVEWALDQHGRAHLSHQHLMLNHLCELDGDTAHAETYFMFVSMNRQGKTVTMLGGRYIDRLERRERGKGHWAIAARVTLRDWSVMDERPDMNDLSSFTSTRDSLSPEMRAFMNGGLGSRRDRDDASYHRPLVVDPTRHAAWRRMAGKA